MQLEDQQVAPSTIFLSGAKSPLTKAFVLLAPFLDQTNTIIVLNGQTITHKKKICIFLFCLTTYLFICLLFLRSPCLSFCLSVFLFFQISCSIVIFCKVLIESIFSLCFCSLVCTFFVSVHLSICYWNGSQAMTLWCTSDLQEDSLA